MVFFSNLQIHISEKHCLKRVHKPNDRKQGLQTRSQCETDKPPSSPKFVVPTLLQFYRKMALLIIKSYRYAFGFPVLKIISRTKVFKSESLIYNYISTFTDIYYI